MKILDIILTLKQNNMKARVKATGEIIEVKVYKREHRLYIRIHGEKTGEIYRAKDLDFNIEDDNTLDYWTRLEHTYAGMAMQGMIRRAYEAYCDDCANYENMIFEDAQALLKDHAEALADVCVEFAHALVEKMKEERK